MNRFVLAALGAVIAYGPARADIPPPPPVAGYKRVTVENKVGVAQEFRDHTFFLVARGPGIGSVTVTELKVAPEKPVAVTVGRYGTAVVAIPKGAAKGYATEKEFHAAVADKKVTGAVEGNLAARTYLDIKTDDARTSIVREHVVEKVDPKEGVIFRNPGRDKVGKEAAPEDADPADESSPEGPTGMPRGGAVVAGVAGFFALALGGLWLARRSRG